MIGQGGRVPPNRIIDNDSTGDVDTNPMFDPQQDGIDFHESLEGMLVQFNNAVATGPTNSFGELSVVADNGRNAGPRTPRGGVIVAANDFNPERFILDDVIGDTPTANTGDKLVGADRGGRRLLVRQLQVLPARTPTGDRQPAARGHRRRRSRTSWRSRRSTSRTSRRATRRRSSPRLADTLVDNLKAPDIVAVEEIQDNDGVAGGTAARWSTPA